MYRLSEFLTRVMGLDQSLVEGCEMCFFETDGERTMQVNRMRDTLDCYTFTLVFQGDLTLLHGNHRLTLHCGDMYIYTPGFALTILDASADYRGACLIVEETLTFETPIVRNMIRAAYFPVAELREPKLSLRPDEADRLLSRMKEIDECMRSDHRFKWESQQLLYGLFVLDVLNFQERSIKSHRHSSRSEDIFISFIRLLPQHFVEHHSVGFYADQLYITPTYLSRVVKQTTGRTVMDYVNQMLVMEASWLLRSTDESIAQIAARLHFAAQASFSKFFLRYRGQSPGAYRRSSSYPGGGARR